MPPTNYMSHPSASHHPAGLRGRLRRRTKKAFTLVEVMIATAVFTMGILGVYAMMIKSYELVTLSRHRDNARALLQTFSDQFLRLETTDPGALGPVIRPLFKTDEWAQKPGDGLVWKDSTGWTWGNLPNDDVNGPMIPLGDPLKDTAMVMGHLTRHVSYVASDGTPTSAHVQTAAGWLLQATFTIEYSISGRMQTQSITVARRVP